MEYKLEILKQKIISARDLRNPAHYFLDQFAGRHHFERDCQKINGSEKQTLLSVFKTGLSKKFALKQGKKMCVLLRYSHTDFVHGFLNYPNLLCTVLYFEDAKLGLMTCIQPSAINRVHYCRINGFSSTTPRVPPSSNPSIYPETSYLLH